MVSWLAGGVGLCQSSTGQCRLTMLGCGVMRMYFSFSFLFSSSDGACLFGLSLAFGGGKWISVVVRLFKLLKQNLTSIIICIAHMHG